MLSNIIILLLPFAGDEITEVVLGNQYQAASFTTGKTLGLLWFTYKTKFSMAEKTSTHKQATASIHALNVQTVKSL